MATAINNQEVQSHLHPKPSWEVEDHPTPKGREEVWRFSPVKLLGSLFEDAPSDGQLKIETQLPDQVELVEQDLATGQELAIEAPIDRAAALAVKLAKHTKVLTIADDAQLSEPVVLNLTGTGADAPVFQHLVIKVGVGAKADITIRHQGLAKLSAKVDLIVGDNAQVNFINLQDWDAQSLHAEQISILVGKDAKVKTVQASLGGRVTRVVERASYAGPGGELEQYGVYFVNGAQHIEHRVFVDHNQPNTVSNVDYRGALQCEGARSVWVGDVLIRPQAIGINTYESNKNLLLTDGCQADSVPNLEIETGDIAGAGHSSSTGRFDDLQLFYLLSRGISMDEAKRLIVQGFFNEIIKQIGVEEIEQRLHAALNDQLVSAAAMTAGNDALASHKASEGAK